MQKKKSENIIFHEWLKIAVNNAFYNSRSYKLLRNPIAHLTIVKSEHFDNEL
jgi:hypothetical protein